jgi:hypothetical protein
MRSLWFVFLLLVPMISIFHVGPVFASPTLTISILAKNGPQTVDVRIISIVPPDSDNELYHWAIVKEEAGVRVSSVTTLVYDFPPGVYNINVWYGADLGGLFMAITEGQLIALDSDMTVTFALN